MNIENVFIDKDTGKTANAIGCTYMPLIPHSYWCYMCNHSKPPNSKRFVSFYHGDELLFTTSFCEEHNTELEAYVSIHDIEIKVKL